MITWLHLSDIHLCPPKTGWDADRILRLLIDDLRKMARDHGLAPDLLLVTGDLAFGDSSIDEQFDNESASLSSRRGLPKSSARITHNRFIPPFMNGEIPL
uniref:Calcineurin-like phosphoesterase n=1 Tax=Candidatus Kentrum sp. DK TaxID=2126562 RepID=A0A450STI8_9GAMM|nr:MAG: hypothetical protein BECKDK2373B_GA0170837_10654 [Candidatus Kentron sp. DK]